MKWEVTEGRRSVREEGEQRGEAKRGVEEGRRGRRKTSASERNSIFISSHAYSRSGCCYGEVQLYVWLIDS
jgi:hypothetical protein